MKTGSSHILNVWTKHVLDKNKVLDSYKPFDNMYLWIENDTGCELDYTMVSNCI